MIALAWNCQYYSIYFSIFKVFLFDDRLDTYEIQTITETWKPNTGKILFSFTFSHYILMFALKCYSFLIYCNRKFDLVTVISHIILVTFTNLANFIFTQVLTEKWCLFQILSPNWLWLNSIFHSSTPNKI